MGLFSSFKNEPSDFEETDDLMDDDSDNRKKRFKDKLDNQRANKVKRNRMGCCATYFAILKAYTTVSIFTLPIGFRTGGWLFSPIVLIIACFFELTSAIKLVQVANKIQIYSYPDIVKYSLGETYY